MRINQWPCICPKCRHHFTAFMLDSDPPPVDEINPGCKSLLCNICEHRFTNFLYRERFGRESRDGVPSDPMHLPPLCEDAHSGSEPGTAAEVGTNNPARVSGRMHALPTRPEPTGSEERIQSRMDAAGEALRGPTALPAE